MTVDHNFVGTITNFGGHNGGTDTITFADPNDAGKVAPSIQYEPNEAGTGGELIVQYGADPAYVLSLIGSYSQNDFAVDPHNSLQIDCSAEQMLSPQVPAHVVDALV
ncbi:MAG TPA: hypothetical protein VGG10_09595 [Rhizomicrobium sp.]